MNAKNKACFAPHAVMHSVIGFGLGLLIAGLVAGGQAALDWIGVILVVLAVIADVSRKS